MHLDPDHKRFLHSDRKIAVQLKKALYGNTECGPLVLPGASFNSAGYGLPREPLRYMIIHVSQRRHIGKDIGISRSSSYAPTGSKRRLKTAPASSSVSLQQTTTLT
jgi:hypothetical protein